MPPVATDKDIELQQRGSLDFSASRLSAFIGFDYRMVIIIIGALAVTAVGAWWILRERRMLRHDSAPEYLILESSVSIEIGDGGIEIEYDDDEDDDENPFETFYDSTTPQRMAFDIDKLPTFRVSCKPGNILERRGRRTLKIQPSEAGDADMALIDIKDGRLTLSPYSSKKEPGRLFGEFAPIRRRPQKSVGIDSAPPSGIIATAPYTLENAWRPLDTGDLAPEKS